MHVCFALIYYDMWTNAFFSVRRRPRTGTLLFVITDQCCNKCACLHKRNSRHRRSLSKALGISVCIMNRYEYFSKTFCAVISGQLDIHLAESRQNRSSYRNKPHCTASGDS